MKWRRTIILWTILFVPLSIYNVLGSPVSFPGQSTTQYQDPRIRHYNFSMASPIYATGNFSASFPLSRPQAYYRLSAGANVSVDYASYGAYGAFPLQVSVAENGVYHSPNNARIDFVLSSPGPPSGYGTPATSTLPDTPSQEVFSHLVEGVNTILLNYTFRFTGIDTQPQNYGPGYFKLNIGTFRVAVTDVVTVYSLGAASELILAVMVLPIAYGTNILLLRLSQRRRARSGNNADAP